MSNKISKKFISFEFYKNSLFHLFYPQIDSDPIEPKNANKAWKKNLANINQNLENKWSERERTDREREGTRRLYPHIKRSLFVKQTMNELISCIFGVKISTEHFWAVN